MAQKTLAQSWIAISSSPVEALTQALILGVIAPDDERSRMAVALAEKIATEAGLSQDDVDSAKSAAEARLGGSEQVTQ